MKEITEDYVSYEIAKLLKEKGFINDFCRKYYNYGPENWHSPLLDEISNFPCNHNFYDGKCSAPTHQVALKWLREVYNIHIEIRYIPSQFTDEPTYKAMIWNMDTEIGTPLSPDISYTYFETCVEAALKYTLENLI